MRINRECWVGDSRIGDYEIAAGIVFRMYYTGRKSTAGVCAAGLGPLGVSRHFIIIILYCVLYV